MNYRREAGPAMRSRLALGIVLIALAAMAWLLLRTRDGRNFVYQAVIDRSTFIRSRMAEIRACLKKNFPSEFAVID